MLRSGEAAGLDCGGSSRASAAPAPGAGYVMCHLPGVVWTSRLGHTYHRPLPPILEPLPDPLATDQPLIPLLVPVDTDWENSQIWEQPPEPEAEPEPPPEPDSHEESPPF